MDEILKANVFFFITSIAVFAVTLGLLIVIVYLIRILNDVKAISKSVREKSEDILDDVEALREHLKSGAWLKSIFDAFVKNKSGKVARSRKTKKENNAS